MYLACENRRSCVGAELNCVSISGEQALDLRKGRRDNAGYLISQRTLKPEVGTYPFRISIRSRMRAWETSFDIRGGAMLLDSKAPFCSSIASSRFRFAKRVMDENASSEGAGGLKTPFGEAMARLVVLAGWVIFGCCVAVSRELESTQRV